MWEGNATGCARRNTIGRESGKRLVGEPWGRQDSLAPPQSLLKSDDEEAPLDAAFWTSVEGPNQEETHRDKWIDSSSPERVPNPRSRPWPVQA